MPAPAKGSRLGGSPAHQRLILANLATQLFDNDRITTTEAKAKRLRPHAERLITIAKKGDLAAIRRVARTIHDKSVANKLITEIAPEMAERNGGYTRIVKIGFRKGDSAPMAVIELVKEAVSKKKAPKAKAQKKRGGSGEDSAKKPTSADEGAKPETGVAQQVAEETEPAASSPKEERSSEPDEKKAKEK